MSFPHDNNLVSCHQTNLKPLLCRSFLENFFPVVKNKFGDDVTETILTNSGNCSVVVGLGRSKSFARQSWERCGVLFLQNVFFFFTNFVCQLFVVSFVFLFSVFCCLMTFMFFWMARSKSPWYNSPLLNQWVEIIFHSPGLMQRWSWNTECIACFCV